jgi:nitrogen fixation/metabolism regulation signal transduction histidine kinase
MIRSNTWTVVGFTVPMVLILALFIGFFLRQFVTRPVHQLRSAVSRIGEGDLSAGIRIRSRDEFGDLAVAFNRMTHDLARAQAENEELERLSRGRDVLLDAAEHSGPTALLRGRITTRNVEAAAGLTLKYGKGRDEPEATVVLRRAKTDKRAMVNVEPASDQRAKELMISRRG